MKKYNPPPRRNFHIGEEGSINFDIGRKFPYGPPPPLFHLFTSLSLPRFSYFFPFLRRDLARRSFFTARATHTKRAQRYKSAFWNKFIARARAGSAPRTRGEQNGTNHPPLSPSLPLEPNFSVQPRPLFHRQGVVSTFTSRCIFKPVSSGNISRPCHRWRPCVIRGERGWERERERESV